jgi:hypothetical protein
MKKGEKQAMERNENKSLITSVSTHCSVKSLKSLSMRRNRAITAENLAILDRINGSVYDLLSDRSEIKEKGCRKDCEENDNNGCWPKIF